MGKTWPLQEAKARFFQLVEEALRLPKPLADEEAEALFARVEAEPREVSLS
ncbi:MAG: hypothetical protein P3W93_010820 [Thermus sp.]|nr:hypothetical protein [Thermus sp.]